MKPLIGISASTQEKDTLGWDFHRLPRTYCDALEITGAIPIIIPNGLKNETLRDLYGRLDGLLLSGGGDLDPSLYQAPPHPATERVSKLRDSTEVQLSRWAYDDNIPILGICRGIQAIAVAQGGSLLQDIPDLVGDDFSHSLRSAYPPHDQHAHPIEIVADSQLAKILGVTRTGVNSLHHQAVEVLPAGFIATAHSPDGIIEAMEANDKSFNLAVQWHPEDMIQSDTLMLRLFAGLVEACSQRELALP